MKKIAPAAIIALKEALCQVYWFKRDFRSFITRTITIPDLLAQVNWQDTKRDIAASLVDHLAKYEDRHQTVLVSLMGEVASVRDFSHLRNMDGGDAIASRAEAAVKALRAYTSGFESLAEEQKRIDERKQAQAEKLEMVNAVKAKLEDMRKDFMAMVATSNAQKRGYLLEAFLRALFELFDLDPRASFKLEGEQIDGAFTFDPNDFILEAKWEKAPLSRAPLEVFQAKVIGKLDNTLGLFIAINGYSTDAIKTYSSGTRKLALLIDGNHLMSVVDGRIALPEMLRRIRRHAAQTGEVYLSIDQILGAPKPD
jgi:hypothetical protein